MNIEDLYIKQHVIVESGIYKGPAVIVGLEIGFITMDNEIITIVGEDGWAYTNIKANQVTPIT
jgi:hypothetical protein